MATRSLNSTGRSRITQDMFHVSVDKEGGTTVLAIEWDIRPLSIGSGKKVVLDVWNDRIERRIELSESGNDVGEQLHTLEAGFASGVIRVRIVAVAVDTAGIPIIRAESITTSFNSAGESTAKSILVVEPVEDLDVIWELDFSAGDVILKVSNREGLWTEYLKQSQVFKSTIVGHVVYVVALHLLATRGELAVGLEKWQTLLDSFGLNIDDSDEEDIEELMYLAREVSNAFQRDRKLLGHLISNLEDID